MFSVAFWKAAAERAIKTAVQTLLALWTVAGTTSLFDVDWRLALGTAGFAALLSVVTSLGSAFAGNNGPSLTSSERLATGRHARPDR